MKLHHNILSILIILLVFSGCKKYEEGPLVSFRTPDARIKGNWTIKEFYINENDSTKELINTYGSQMYFNLYDRGDDNELNAIGISGAHHGLLGKWDFVNGTKNLKMEIFSMNGYETIEIYGPINEGRISEWDILKLTNEEFKFKTTYNNIDYKFILEKME